MKRLPPGPTKEVRRNSGTLDASLHTRLCDLLNCRYPILQAGMGGVARSELVAAVSRAGGYGFLGMVRESPDLIASEIDAVRQSTDRPFGVNLIPSATDPVLFDEQIALCIEKAVDSFCFFWDVDESAVARARASGALVLYQVGSVLDAKAAEAAGADIVIAQGFEAGGHVRGTVSSLVLLPQVVGAVSVPVVASGGFSSGHGLAAAFALGCDGVQFGTAFLATRESYAHELHKAAVLAATSEDTIHTEAFAINWPPASPTRVIANTTTQLPEAAASRHPDAIPRTRIGWQGDRPIFRFSTDSPLRDTRGELGSMALFAGQVAGAIDSLPSAGELVDRIAREARDVLQRLSSRCRRHAPAPMDGANGRVPPLRR